VKAWAVVPAAGSGTRLGGRAPKALAELAGRPLIAHVVLALLESRSIEGIVIVGPAEVFHAVEGWCPDVAGVEGEATRQGSVRVGLAVVPDTVTRVVVHDAARPLVTPDLIERVVAATRRADAVVPALPVHDTLKRGTGDAIAETVDREGLWRAQTPQCFRTFVLKAAHERALEEGFEGTDDAAIVERFGVKPAIVRGEEWNFKITTQEDLDVAEALVRALWWHR
jgi:2-C-methyl-D-erythritol 4-phosphate cytidylyltransferase